MAAVHAHHISSSVSASVVLLIINRKIRERQHDQKVVEDVADWKCGIQKTLLVAFNKSSEHLESRNDV